VWFDAPIGYISATKQWAIDHGKDWRPYWEDKETRLIHFIGKDNIVFHCIIFPVMLQLHGNILPDNVPANEFLNLEGDKMSTSRNWKLDMEDYINDFIKAPGGNEIMADVLRYYLTQIAPETKDSEFTWKGFQDANNSELVAILGNFVNRSLVLMHKLCKGKVPPLHPDHLTDADREMLAAFDATRVAVEENLEQFKFREALFQIISFARSGNQFLQKKEPWIFAKQIDANGEVLPEAQATIDNTLHIALQVCANLAIFVHPFLPFTAKKICYLLKVVDKMLLWENAGKTKLLSTGYSLRAPELLFRKIEDEEIALQLNKLHTAMIENPVPGAAATPVPSTPAPVKESIVYDDFAKLDLRNGKIIAAEKVEKADKLLKLTVDLGFETRTIVSGIAQHFSPDAIVGKQVTVVVNLQPRKMRGIESNGMILMAEDAHGKLHFIHPEESIAPGSSIS
jgi:methionyl-tRNA synthetase